MYYLEAHQRGGLSSRGLDGTIDSLWAAGVEGVPARKGFMASAHPYPAIPGSLRCRNPQNAGLHSTGTALPQVAACTPKHSNERNLPISPTGTGISASVGGGWVFRSLSFSLNYVKHLREQPQKSDFQPTWRKICHFSDYVCCRKIHSTKSVLLWGLARHKPYWGTS